MQRTTLLLREVQDASGGMETIRHALKAVPGVARVHVNPSTEMAYVEYDDARCSRAQLTAALDAQRGGDAAHEPCAIVEKLERVPHDERHEESHAVRGDPGPVPGPGRTSRISGSACEPDAQPPGRQPSSPASRESRELQCARAVVAELFGDSHSRNFGVRYWDGYAEPGRQVTMPFTLVLQRSGALRRMLLPPSELALGEAFVRGDFDVEGDLEAAAALGPVIAERLRSPRRLTRVARLLLQLPSHDRESHGKAPERRSAHPYAGRRHTRHRDAEVIRFHYDVGNDFYALWLDAQRVYSCGYFPTGAEDIDAAQVAKLEHICRKLLLRPGERLLDIGCGWGGLLRYAARQYGVEAVGITLSPAQAEYAGQRIAADGLEARCRVEVRDYRDLPRDATFDKVVSVGMFEHVGPAQLPTYFGAAFRLTAPRGLFLNHGIVSLEDARPRSLSERLGRRLWRQGEFMDRHVFPDGELVTLSDAIRTAEAAGFETRDAESLREHYARTLLQWVQRLEERRAEAVAIVGDTTYRVWRLYMAVSAHAFTVGRIGLVQTLLAKPDAAGRCCLPPTREDLYSGRARP